MDVAVEIDQEIRRLDVSMNHACTFEKIHSAENLHISRREFREDDEACRELMTNLVNDMLDMAGTQELIAFGDLVQISFYILCRHSM